MAAKKPCFYFVTSLFVNDNGTQIFYQYEQMCTRPWGGLNFAPKLPEVKQYILDKDYRKVHKFFETLRIKRNAPKHQVRNRTHTPLRRQLALLGLGLEISEDI